MSLNCLMISLLVFGTLLSFLLVTCTELPNQEEGVKMIRLAREEATSVRSGQRIAAVIKTNSPPSAKYKIRTGDSVKGYSEKKRKWKQELKFLEVPEKQVLVSTGNRVVKLNISRVLHTVSNNNERDIMEPLRSISTFSAGEPPETFLTDYIFGDDPRQ